MTLAIRRRLALFALVGLVATGPTARAEDDPKAAEAPPAYVLPPTGWPTVKFDQPDFLLDRPEAPLPGPFFNVETQFLAIHLRNQMFNSVPLADGSLDTVRFNANPIDETVSPRFEVGWRLPDGWGELRFGYRFLVSSGSGSLAAQRILTDPNGNLILTDLGSAHEGGRLNFNVADFAYWSREYSLERRWEMRWGVGARMMFLYYDSHFTVDDPGTGAGSLLSQGMSDSTRAYGGFAALDLSYRTAVPGLALCGRIDAGQLFGRVKQIYNVQVVGADGGPQNAALRNDGSIGPPMLNLQFGLTYTVPDWNNSRFLIGYQRETWWQIGRLDEARGQLEVQGLVLRAEINF
jgi:hypothetical protein